MTTTVLPTGRHTLCTWVYGGSELQSLLAEAQAADLAASGSGYFAPTGQSGLYPYDPATGRITSYGRYFFCHAELQCSPPQAPIALTNSQPDEIKITPDITDVNAYLASLPSWGYYIPPQGGFLVALNLGNPPKGYVYPSIYAPYGDLVQSTTWVVFVAWVSTLDPNQTPHIVGYAFVEIHQDGYCCTVGVQGGGGGGGGGGNVSSGIELLTHRKGFYCAQAGDTVSVRRSWHSDLKFDFGSSLPAGDEPSLCLVPPGEGVDLIVRTGTGQPGQKDAQGNAPPFYSLFRRISYDCGETWMAWPTDSSGQPQSLINNVKHARQLYNRRTQEYCLAYNDTSDRDANNAPTGKGYLQVRVWDAKGNPVDTYPVDNSVLAADSAFSIIPVPDPTAHIRLAFIADSGHARHYASWDDCRTWTEILPDS